MKVNQIWRKFPCLFYMKERKTNEMYCMATTCNGFETPPVGNLDKTDLIDETELYK